METKISVIIPAKNESSLIEDAIKSVDFCAQIIVIDNHSTDNTVKIAKQNRCQVISTSHIDYDERKNVALPYIKYPWLLHIDADERVSPELRSEITSLDLRSTPYAAFQLNRKNIYLGQQLTHGGWGKDNQIRLFSKSKLSGWRGALHEQPVVTGAIGKLEGSLVHLSHRNLETMVEKTIIFTDKESELRWKNDHPPVVTWRFFRVMLTEMAHRFVRHLAFLDGTPGIIDGLFQVFNMYIIYARLWEKQKLHARRNL